MRKLLISTFLVSLVVAACSSTSGTHVESGDAATVCTGLPPIICDGCCGTKYAADECLNGEWACKPREVACVACDAGMDAMAADASGDAATCTGTRPNCFGSDSNLCCANDPSGPATCSNGEWMCGSAQAPGCDGTSCLLHDAGRD